MADAKKIMIVDDDSRNIFALSAVLRSKGFQVVSAPGGREGIDLLNNNSEIGVVLMDMMMPEMDGYEAIAEIRSNHETTSIPIIAVTAQAMVGDREKSLSAGADAYVSKPINVDVLVSLLNDYLS